MHLIPLGAFSKGNLKVELQLARACCKSPFCSRSADAYIRELFENPCHVRAEVGIRAPILPVSQQPLASVDHSAATPRAGWDHSSASQDNPRGKDGAGGHAV